MNSSAHIKKGNNDGKTTSNQTCKPETLACNDCSGNIIKQEENNIMINEKTQVFTMDRINNAHLHYVMACPI